MRIGLLDEESNVVMMSEKEWEGWQATAEVMADPVLMKAIRESEAEMEKGAKGIPLDEAFTQLGWQDV